MKCELCGNDSNESCVTITKLRIIGELDAAGDYDEWYENVSLCYGCLQEIPVFIHGSDFYKLFPHLQVKPEHECERCKRLKELLQKCISQLSEDNTDSSCLLAEEITDELEIKETKC